MGAARSRTIIDARGRHVPNPDSAPNEKGALVYPDDDGSANWFSPSGAILKFSILFAFGLTSSEFNDLV